MLSIVTLTFENPEELERTIASTRGLAVPFEHVVVNGGTCARTRAFLETLPGEHVSEPDDGIADAFNKGLARARGDLVLFLNSGDVLIDPAYVEAAVAAFEADPGLDFTCADVRIEHFSGVVVTRRSGARLPEMPFNHPTLICRRSVFAAIGGFDPALRLAMDLDFAYRLVLGGFRGRHFDRAAVLMDGTGLSARRHFLAYREKVRLILRYRRLDGPALRHLVLGLARVCAGTLGRRLLPASRWAAVRRRMLERDAAASSTRQAGPGDASRDDS